MHRQEQSDEKGNRGATWVLLRILGVLSYFLALAVYVLALGLVAYWFFAAMNIETPVPAPVTETTTNGVIPPRPTVLGETLSILVGFSALLGTAAALLWSPVIIARASSRVTHRVSSWLSPHYTINQLLLVKALLYTAPLFVLLGAMLSYYTGLNVSLFFGGLAAWAAALVIAGIQTIIGKRMQYDAGKIF